MSSKIVTGDGRLPAKPIAWKSVGPAPPNPASSPPGAAQPAATPPPEQSRAARYEERIQELERAVEARANHARQEGYQQGETAGRERAAAQLAPFIERLTRTIEELAGLRARLRKQAEEDVVKLSLAVARRILHRELAMDPDALLGVVRAAMEKLDLRETQRVRVHPQDTERLRNSLEAIGLPRAVDVTADPGLERGAVVFETSRGTFDASVETQIEEIGRGFSDLLHRRTQ